jgi:tryptophan synthase alpha chain
MESIDHEAEMNRAWTPTMSGLERLRAQFTRESPAIIAYVPFGDPVAAAEQHLDVYCDAGVSVLEVGMPTLDAYLDGPEVGDSMRRARVVGATPWSIAEDLGRWRAQRGDTSPAVVWMGYPDLDLSCVKFAASIDAIDGLLIVDEEQRPDAPGLRRELDQLGIAHCTFVSWDVTPLELNMAATATGYVMVQARSGPTGTGNPPGIPDRQVRLARSSAPHIPVVAGFGVQDPAGLRDVAAAGVDGIVVGSACVRALTVGGAPMLDSLLRSLVLEAGTLSRDPISSRRES